MGTKTFAVVVVLMLVLIGIPMVYGQAATVDESVTLETPTGTLYGTLLVPASKKPCPVVLIIAGSGPTDRNGNSPLLPGANNSNKMLADGLADAGIASLRYDKRGIAASAKAMVSESDIRFDTYVSDAEIWAKKLRADKRFSTLTIAGHSEGSLIGMIAAKNVGADGYVSIAGVGRPANLILHDQLKPQLPEAMMKQADEALTTLAAGKTLGDFPPQLASLFRASVQPYMISWFHYDPAKEIAKLTIPILIVQGSTDIQVSVDDAKMLSKGAPAAKLLIIEGMNHVLKQVPADKDLQTKSYSDPTLPIDKTLLGETINLVKKAKKSK